MLLGTGFWRVDWLLSDFFHRTFLWREGKVVLKTLYFQDGVDFDTRRILLESRQHYRHGTNDSIAERCIRTWWRLWAVHDGFR
jgi:hypothetical protein